MENTDSSSRKEILRDVLIFQAKLWLEGFKDVVLVPLSLGAAVIDLVFYKRERRGTLYSVMRLGDQFERWVDLYAAMDGPDDRTETSAKESSAKAFSARQTSQRTSRAIRPDEGHTDL